MSRGRATAAVFTATLALTAGAVAAPAVSGAAPSAGTQVAAATTAKLPGALQTNGRWIVDRKGKHVKLASVNWSGGETQAFVVGGLDHRSLKDLARLISAGGFNSVRIPWSNELVRENPVVEERFLKANPQLVGKRALAVMDSVIRELGRNGVMVILDNHRSRADWCCDEAHGDGMWYTREYPEREWIAHWKLMAKRYTSFSNVVGAELRNEIRPDPSLRPGPTHATWGDGNPLTDWKAAAERAGNAILDANKNLLIIVGGTEYQGNLTGVAKSPVRLKVKNRLVYAAHDYRWFHGDDQLKDYAKFAQHLDNRWGFVATPGMSYAAPVYVSETGTCTNPNPTEQCHTLDPTYLANIVRYVKERDLDWAYWPFNGTQGTGYNRIYDMPETYGLLAPDWSGYGNVTVLRAFQSVQRPTQGPGVEDCPR